MVTEVGLVGGSVVVVGLAKDEDVVTATEGVLEDGGGAEVDVRVVARGLVGRGTVEIPDAKLADIGDLLANGLERGYQARNAVKQGVSLPWSLT